MVATVPISQKEVAFTSLDAFGRISCPLRDKKGHGLIFWHSNCIIHNSEAGTVPVLRGDLRHGG